MSRIGDNIRILRKYYGESGRCLADAINLDHTTLSNYENGKNKKDIDETIIELIANRYGVRPASLRYDDYSILSGEKEDNVTREIADNVSAYYRTQYPSFTSIIDCYQYSDMLNSAIKSHRDVVKTKYENADMFISDSRKVIDKYRLVEQTKDKHMVIALINKVSVIMTLFQFFDSFEHPIYDYQTSRRLDGQPRYLQEERSYPDEETELTNGFYNAYFGEVIDALCEITDYPSHTYQDYGYYYLAYRYCCGFCDTSNPRIESATIGFQMMRSFALMGNKLAHAYLDYAISTYRAGNK